MSLHSTHPCAPPRSEASAIPDPINRLIRRLMRSTVLNEPPQRLRPILQLMRLHRLARDCRFDPVRPF